MTPTAADKERDLAFNTACAEIAKLHRDDVALEVGSMRQGIILLCKVLHGVQEVGTSNRGYWVDRITERTHGTGLSWCASYVDFVTWQVCRMLGRPDILPLNTAGTQTLARYAEEHGCTVKDPALADIVVWQQIGDKAHGHTGFVTGFDGQGGIKCVEGNTSDRKASRDGGTVAEHTYPNGTGATSTRSLRCFISIASLCELAWSPK